ncbi:MAG: ribbon-helix-helix domain-containing protein [Thermodesulfobacteriota bacterium]
MKTTRNKESEEYQRVLVTLPKPLVGELQRYAKSFRNGNKSGFIADAIKEKIEHIHKVRYTEKIRDSYRAAASRNKKIMDEWEDADMEVLDRLEDRD